MNTYVVVIYNELSAVLPKAITNFSADVSSDEEALLVVVQSTITLISWALRICKITGILTETIINM